MLNATLIFEPIKTLGGEEAVLCVDGYLTLGGDTDKLSSSWAKMTTDEAIHTLIVLNNTCVLFLHNGDIEVGAFYPDVGS